jgi:hypothetical protein
MSKIDDKLDRDTINKALAWAAKTPLKMGTKEFEDGIRAMLRNPSAGGPSAPRGDNISPSPLGAADNDDFATIPHLGPVA